MNNNELGKFIRYIHTSISLLFSMLVGGRRAWHARMQFCGRNIWHLSAVWVGGVWRGYPVAICLYECQTQRRFISVRHDSWVTGTAGTAVVLRSRGGALKSLQGRTMSWEVWARMHSHSHRYIHRCKVGQFAFDAKLITVRGYWLSNTWTPMGRRPHEHAYIYTYNYDIPWSHHLSGRVKSQTELFFVERNLAWNKTFLSFLAVFMNQVFCPTIRVHSSSPLEMDTISGWMLSSAWDFKMICGQSQRE